MRLRLGGMGTTRHTIPHPPSRPNHHSPKTCPMRQRRRKPRKESRKDVEGRFCLQVVDAAPLCSSARRPCGPATGGTRPHATHLSSSGGIPRARCRRVGRHRPWRRPEGACVRTQIGLGPGARSSPRPRERRAGAQHRHSRHVIRVPCRLARLGGWSFATAHAARTDKGGSAGAWPQRPPRKCGPGGPGATPAQGNARPRVQFGLSAPREGRMRSGGVRTAAPRARARRPSFPKVRLPLPGSRSRAPGSSSSSAGEPAAPFPAPARLSLAHSTRTDERDAGREQGDRVELPPPAHAREHGSPAARARWQLAPPPKRRVRRGRRPDAAAFASRRWTGCLLCMPPSPQGAGVRGGRSSRTAGRNSLPVVRLPPA